MPTVDSNVVIIFLHVTSNEILKMKRLRKRTVCYIRMLWRYSMTVHMHSSAQHSPTVDENVSKEKSSLLLKRIKVIQVTHFDAHADTQAHTRPNEWCVVAHSLGKIKLIFVWCPQKASRVVSNTFFFIILDL